MKTKTLAIALIALALSAPAGALPDVRTDGGVTWARFGSLGRNDYVVTNAPVSSPAALPKYLHERSFDDSYPDEAAEYYRSRGDGRVDGGCSAVRDGGFVRRNFDFPFDERAEFVVRMSAGAGRFASVGVAQVGTNLTEDIVTSGRPEFSYRYKWLPGATVDGINECGVAVAINVSDDVPSWRSTGSLHPLGVVRWILDHATNALHGAEYVAANVGFPAGWVQNFHYMVADREKTYLVENGEVYDFDDYHESDEPATMTNFPLNRFPWDGMGMERFGLLLRGESITNAWYTRAYRRETTPPWVSEFSADVLARTNEIFNAWASHQKEYFRGKTNGGQTWWQTVHTSIYDLTNRVLRVAVQETDDWYMFAVSFSGAKVDTYTRAETDAKLDGKRDKTDAAVWEEAPFDYYTDSTGRIFMRTSATSDRYDGGDGFELDYGYPSQYGDGPIWRYTEDGFISYEMTEDGKNNPSAPSISFPYGQTFTRHPAGTLVPVSRSFVHAPDETTSGIAAFDGAGKLKAAMAGTDYQAPLSQDQLKNIADVPKKADEFTRFTWTSEDPNLPAGWLDLANAQGDNQPLFGGGYWSCGTIGGCVVVSPYAGTESDLVVVIQFGTPTSTVFSATATRKRVLRTGEAATPQELATKQDALPYPTNAIPYSVIANPPTIPVISETDQTFSNAVLAVTVVGLSTNITSEVYIATTNACANLGIDPALIPGEGTIGTVGGFIAMLFAVVFWMRKKIFDNSGKVNDTFAGELLGKPVAKTALMIPLESKTGNFKAEDGHAYSVTSTSETAATVTIEMPTTTENKAAIFQARFSATAGMSVQFDTDDVVKFDGADCGIVKAGKDALLSAMWNGEAWDLVWKNEA